MKKLPSCITIIFIAFICSNFSIDLKGQEQILWLMNGKKIVVQNYQLDSTDRLNQKIFYTNAKGIAKDLFADEVFSYTGIDSKENIFYHPQPELGETFSIPEMRDFLTGLGDAKKHSLSPWLIIGGYTSGLVGAFIPSPELQVGENYMPMPIGILIPASYVGLSGILSPEADKLKEKVPNTIPTEPYMMGYQEGVKKKIIKNSMLSAGVGLIAGFIIIVAAN